MLGTKLYSTWSNMMRRCYNPTDKGYNSYSKKGVCSRWHEFENFKSDMRQTLLIHVTKYGKENTTFDRIDNSKGYSPKNCRWTTWEVQVANTGLKIKTICTNPNCKYEWSVRVLKPKSCPKCRQYLRV